MIEQESVVADFDDHSGITEIVTRDVDYFNTMKPLLFANGKIRLDSKSKIIISRDKDGLPSTLLDVVIAVSTNELEFNNRSDHYVIDSNHPFITSSDEFMEVTNIEMAHDGIRADFVVKKKK